MDFNDWTKPEEKTSQGYGNDYYRNPQQHQYYNNTGYQDPKMDGRFSQPDFNNSGYSREKLYAEERRKIEEKGNLFDAKGKSGKLFLIWFIASLVLSVFGMCTVAVAMMILGQLFAGVGIAFFLKRKRSSDNLPILILPLLGIPSFVSGLLYVLVSEPLKQQLSELAPFLFMYVLFIVGVELAVIIPISDKKHKDRCTEPVTAVVVDRIRSRNGSGISYYPVYEYYYKGKVHWGRDSHSRSVYGVGNKVELFVNPDDPSDFYVKSKK